MRKLFLLIPVMLISLIANAAVINIDNTTANAVQTALNNAASGDIIEMAAGTYEESGNYLAFTGKELTVRAAEGAEVIIRTVCPVRLKEGAKAEFINIKFDCSTIGSYDYVIVAADDTENKRVVLTGCEFYGWTKEKAMIEATSSRRLDAITIDNCYFHDCMKSVVFVENTGYNDLSITNSTFANITTSANFSAGVIDSRATSGSILVDHCTFYNVQAMNTDYAAIGKVKLTSGAVVSNCIFALSEPGASSNRTIRDVVAANNCLIYNYSTDGGYGMQSNVTKNNCFIADPLFNDLANNKYTFAGDWTTMNLSPARGAATDGSDLGDPRWYSIPILPEVDFASPYQFIGPKALLTGQIGLNTNDHIEYYDTEAKGTATWKIHATRACVLNATLNMEAGSSSGHKFKVEVLDADGNSVGELAEPSSTSSDGNINLPGTLSIPAEGDYTVILYNLTAWSSAKLEGVTLTYVGGDVQAMPGTTNIADAWFSSNGTRADGKISYSSIGSGCWAKWNINVAAAGTYNVTVNISGQYGHKYVVEFLKEGESTPIVVTTGTTNYTNNLTLYANELGAVALEAGNYEMNVFNDVGDAALHSVTLAYAGGAAVDLSKAAPANLLANADAIVSDDWSIEDNKITHAESKALTGWAKWNVNSADYGNYNVTVNISSDNGHLVRVEVFEDENNPAIYTLNETETTKHHYGEQAIDLGNIALEDKEYVFKVSNTEPYSHVQIASIVITYKGGAVITIPNAAIPLADAMLSANAYIDGEGLHFSDADHKSHVDQEWAKWNIHASAGAYTFTFNVNGPDHGIYTIEVLDGNNSILSETYGHTGEGSYTTGSIYLEGDYVVQMQNTNNFSEGYITSLSATTVSNVLIVDEMATDMQYIIDADGQSMKPALKRTFRTGVYNSICLPFNVGGADELTKIFGAGYELLEMTAATLDGSVLTLSFTTPASNIQYGRPYLIKPTKDVVNPMFSSHTINKSTSHLTVSGTDANFVGVLNKQDLGTHPENLYLGADGNLYFSNSDVTIKGFRAYFHVNVPNPQQVIKRANIVAGEQVITSVDFVKDAKNASIKTIENGQIIIIRDGVRYNVMGVKIQ